MRSPRLLPSLSGLAAWSLVSLTAATALLACDDSPPPSPSTASPSPSPSTAASATAGSSTATLAATSSSSAPRLSASPPLREPCLVVTSLDAPLIRKPTKDASAQDVVYKGELVKLVREDGTMSWSGKMDGQKASRAGTLLEVKHVDDGAHRFAFRPDFGDNAVVPVTAWLCDAISAQGEFQTSRCAAELRRARTADGALLAYWPCTSGLCPVGLLRAGKMAVLGVEDLSAARFFHGKKRSMLLATVRWTKDEGKQSGGALVPILLDGPAPVRGADIPIDRIDARDPAKVIDHIVQVKITPTEVIVKGEETVRSAATGATLSKRPVEEKHPLPSLD